MTIQISSKLINSIKGIEDSALKERVVIALPALIGIPAIDYFNKSVDPETRKYSAIKSAIKIGIGTVNSLFARVVGQKIGESLVKSGKIKPLTQAIAQDPEKIAKFTKSVGKTAAFVATIVSIVCMDIPFIDKALKVVMDKIFPNKKNWQSKDKVNDRKYNIKSSRI